MRGMSVMLVLLVLALSLAIASVGIAADTKPAAKSAQNFGKKVAYYPVNVVQKSGEAVVTAGKKTADTVGKTVTATAGVASGKLDQTKAMVEDPIMGSADAVGTAAKDTIMVPYTAAQEDNE